jgi:S1-C subfamily serine protease
MNKTIGVLIMILVSAGFVGGLAVSNRLSSGSSVPAAELQQTAAPAPLPAARVVGTPAAASGGLPDLSTVAEAALKVAANITSTNLVRRDDPWSLFFMEEPSYRTAQSLGSGVVVSSDGLILTNTHVIGGANASVRVTLPDGSEREARIVGRDELSDLTVLRVEATGLPTIPWGDSRKLRVAEWVLAIGNPFQLSGTVTLGIVSNVSRSQSGGVTDFIQTDAAINQGNSGGALVNARGELVGINSMIYSETGGNLGIGFAIPSHLARQIMNDLVTHGAVPWGSIGYVQWIEPGVARLYGLKISGLLVYRIDQGSPAYRGGLRGGDVVQAFNGQKVDAREQLEGAVARSKPGTRATLEVDRDGKRLTLTVPIESRQEQRSPVRSRRR